MLILNLCDFLFDCSVANDESMINAAKLMYNTMGLCQNTIGAYILFFNNDSELCKWFIELLVRITAIDMFFVFDYTSYIHHSIIFGIYFVYRFFNLDFEKYKKTFIALLTTEMSTIWLAFRNFIHITGYFSFLELPISLIFAAVFMYTRIIVCGGHALFELDYSQNFCLKTVLLSLLCINLFWGHKILQKAYDKLIAPATKNV